MADSKDSRVGGTGPNPQAVDLIESTKRAKQVAAPLVLSDQRIKELMETIFLMFATDGSDRHKAASNNSDYLAKSSADKR